MKMKMLLAFLAGGSILSWAILGMAGDIPPAASQAGAIRPVLNIRDFGAVGDGKADDTGALVKALESAGKPDPANPGRTFPATVFVPAGAYRITKTIKMTTDNMQVSRIEGEGALDGRDGFRSALVWDGPEGGHLFDVHGYLALRLGDLALDGGKKAGILLRVNSIPGIGTGLWYFERLQLENADTGIELGADMDSCASDMTFVDCNFSRLKVAGFRTMACQNVDYVFIRCIANWVPIGFHFVKGGNGHFILPAFGRVRTALKIDAGGGGINGGTFSVTGLQLETFNYDSEKKRFVILDASGETNVSFQTIFTGCGQVWGPDGDFETPNFVLGPSAQVAIRDSMISGRIAKLTGAKGQPATWLQIENCRFRCASDPRKDITADEFSGYELRNCQVILDDTKGKAEDYNASCKPMMIRRLSKYPQDLPFEDREIK